MILHVPDPPNLNFGQITSTEAFIRVSELADRYAANFYAAELEKLAAQFRAAGSATSTQEE